MKFIINSKKKISVLIFMLVASLYASYAAWLLYVGPHKFIITSYGGSGTNWLSKNINSIRGVLCTQHIYNLEFKNGPIKTSINDATSIEEYFNKINFFKLYPTKALGNVHGFSYAKIASEAKSIKNLTVVNLIRHPISRIESGYMTNILLEADKRRFNKEHNQIDKYNAIINESEYYNKIIAKYGASIFHDYKNILFLQVLARQDKAYEDMRMCVEDNIPQVRFEDITKDPRALTELVSKISGGSVILSEKEANHMINKPPLNNHHNISLSSEQKYVSWQDWKKYAFLLHLQQNNKRELYELLGYSLDYVTE